MFYDHNEISIEDDTNIAFTEDTPARYQAYGWHVQVVEGGENVVGIEEAIAAAKAVTDKPSFIAVRTIIGYPAPTKMNTGKAHGSALGAEEVAAVKEILGFDPEKTFEVRDEVIEHTRKLVARGKEAHEKWQGEFDAWARAGAGAQGAAGPAAGPGAARRLGCRPDRTGSRAPRRWPPARRSVRS